MRAALKTEAANLTGFAAFDDNLTGLWLIQLFNRL